jgi:hypothetical protein
MELVKKRFEFAFGEPEHQGNINAPSSELLQIFYLSYLFNSFNSRRKNKGFFDIGILKTGHGSKFLWGLHPLIPLEGESRRVEDFMHPHICPLLMLQVGAALSGEFAAADEIAKYHMKKCSNPSKEDLPKCHGRRGCEAKAMELIVSNPRLLRFCGEIHVRDEVELLNPEAQFRKASFDYLHTKLCGICELFGRNSAGYSNEVKAEFAMPDFHYKEHDLLLAIKKRDGNIIILNIELASGTGKKPYQILCQHLSLKRLFRGMNNVSIKSILFCPVDIGRSFVNSMDHDLEKIKNKGWFQEELNNFTKSEVDLCFSGFKIEEEDIPISELVNQMNVEQVIKKHLSALYNQISQIVLQ